MLRGLKAQPPLSLKTAYCLKRLNKRGYGESIPVQKLGLELELELELELKDYQVAFAA
jgi:hypothetical protein